jgi:hypothetical protein
MIFFHDKHWYHSEPLFSIEEEDEEKDEEKELNEMERSPIADMPITSRSPSPTPSQTTVTSAPASSLTAKKPEYEFLLFNYLLRFVHREGQIGDFARAGLLFLMDVAMSPGESTHQIAGGGLESDSSDPISDAALALAEYIVDGDFSDVLSAGLCAVYSLLPAKLEFRPNLDVTHIGTGMVIGGLDTEDEKAKLEEARVKSRAMGVEEASNPDFKSRLDHFLKLLEFIQDVLRRNVHEAQDATFDASALVGSAIVSSIVDAIRRVFLENVLYPSVLECSDNDGSAVAVMSYIDIMIRTLDDGQLSDLIVNFLMTEDNDEVVRTRPRHQSTMTLGESPSSGRIADKATKHQRRKSSAMMLLEMEAPESRKVSEYFTSMGRFTLKDLVMSNLKSKSQPAATAALQLLQSMLLQYSQLSIERLLIVIPDPEATSFPEPALRHPLPDVEDDEEFVYPGAETEKPGAVLNSTTVVPLFVQPETTYSTHEREMGLYLTLVSRVDPSHNEDAFSTGYDHYLRDALLVIQGQRSYNLDADAESRARLKHRLNVHDPILTLVLESLRRFFSNTPEFNIALTSLLATLAINPDRSLAGWLTFAVNDTPRYLQEMTLVKLEDDGDDRSIDFRIEENLANELNPLPASRMDEQSRPVVHSIFYALVAQLERYRQLVDDFDKYLVERRQGLLFDENLMDALSLALELSEDPQVISKPTASATSASEIPAKQILSDTAQSIRSFLTPKKQKTTPRSVNLDPPTPTKSGNKNVAASPFGPHYQKTNSINVEPFIAHLPSSNIWAQSKARRKWNADEEDVFTASGQWGEKDDERDEEKNEENQGNAITLSQLLDNVVILEESIKELVAIIHARRSLGIDSVRYL